MSPLLWLLYEHEKLNLTRCLLEFDLYSNSRDEYFRCYCKQIFYQTIFTVLPYILILSKFFFFYLRTNAQVIVLKTVLKFTLK